MIAYEIDYQRPTTVQEAVKALGTGRDAKVLAGGHSLIPLMKLGLAQPRTLVDIGGIASLREIRATATEITIGALATHEQVASHAAIAKSLAALSDAAASVGDVQVRARGTVGGSLSHADPAADEPAAILALDATLVAVGPKGERTIKAAEFFKGTFETALAPDEILTQIRIPIPSGGTTGSAYRFFPHPASGFAVVGVAVVITRGADGAIKKAQIAITGAAERPYRASAAEKALQGTRGDAAAIAKAAGLAADRVTPLDDLTATATFRKHLAGVFTKRATSAALERAT